MTFKPGQSGNPLGVKNARLPQIRALLLPHIAEAIDALIADLKCPDKRGAAARDILDRYFGKAPQAITGADGGAIRFEMIDRPGPVHKTQWIVEYDLRNQSNQLTQSNQQTPETQDQPPNLVRS